MARWYQMKDEVALLFEDGTGHGTRYQFKLLEQAIQDAENEAIF